MVCEDIILLASDFPIERWDCKKHFNFIKKKWISLDFKEKNRQVWQLPAACVFNKLFHNLCEKTANPNNGEQNIYICIKCSIILAAVNT